MFWCDFSERQRTEKHHNFPKDKDVQSSGDKDIVFAVFWQEKNIQEKHNILEAFFPTTKERITILFLACFGQVFPQEKWHPACSVRSENCLPPIPPSATHGVVLISFSFCRSTKFTFRDDQKWSDRAWKSDLLHEEKFGGNKIERKPTAHLSGEHPWVYHPHMPEVSALVTELTKFPDIIPLDSIRYSNIAIG